MSAPAFPALRELPWAVRAGLTGIVLVLLIGFWASVQHLVDHHEGRDGQEGISLDDVRGSYHGLDSPARLLTRLEEGHPEELAQSDRDLLLNWLRSDRVSEGYDDLDLGDLAPAEILDRSCLDCHSRRAEKGDGIGQSVPLEYWDDVEKLAYSRQIDAVPEDILIVSTHTHALSLAVVTLALGFLVLGTRWPAFLRHGVFLVGGLALTVDIASWWLARWSALFVPVLVGAGAAYVAAMILGGLAILLDLWLPRSRESRSVPPQAGPSGAR